MRRRGTDFTGLLSSIGENSGRTGAGYGYIDTFKRMMAPEVDMNDADSLMNYANYARRNGYDEEAKQYMLLGATQQKAQDKKAYSSGLAKDTEKMRGYNSSIKTLRTAIDGYEKSDVRDSDVGPVANPKLENARIALSKVEQERVNLINSMNTKGETNMYGVASAGSDADRALSAEDYALRKQSEEDAKRELERNAATASFAEDIEAGKPSTLQDFQTLGLSKKDYDNYIAEYNIQLQNIETYGGPNSAAGIGMMKRWQTGKLTALKERGQRQITQVEAKAPGVAGRALSTLVDSLNTQDGQGWFARKFTDQADSLTWIQNSDNAEVVNKIAISSAKAVMLNDVNAPEMSDSELNEAVQKEFVKQLSAFSSEFAEEYEEDITRAAEKRGRADARTAIENKTDGYGEGSGRQEFLDSQSAKFAKDLVNVDPSIVTSDWVRENHNDLWQDWNSTFTKVWRQKKDVLKDEPYYVIPTL